MKVISKLVLALLLTSGLAWATPSLEYQLNSEQLTLTLRSQANIPSAIVLESPGSAILGVGFSNSSGDYVLSFNPSPDVVGTFTVRGYVKIAAIEPTNPVTFTLGGMGGDDGASCRYYQPTGVELGMESPINEQSGCATSQLQDRIIFGHSDSGGPSNVYAMDQSGQPLWTYHIPNVQHKDFESMDPTPCPAGANFPGNPQHCLVVGEIGGSTSSEPGPNRKFLIFTPTPEVSLDGPTCNSTSQCPVTNVPKFVAELDIPKKDYESLTVVGNSYLIVKKFSNHDVYCGNIHELSSQGTNTPERIGRLNLADSYPDFPARVTDITGGTFQPPNRLTLLAFKKKNGARATDLWEWALEGLDCESIKRSLFELDIDGNQTGVREPCISRVDHARRDEAICSPSPVSSLPEGPIVTGEGGDEAPIRQYRVQ